MRFLTVLLLSVVLGCTPQPEEPTPSTPEATTTTHPEPGTDVSVSLEVGDDGGSLQTSSDDGSTSVDAKVDIDAPRKKKSN